MLPVGSSEMDALLKKFNSLERILGYILFNIYKEIGCVSDAKIAILSMNQINPSDPMGAFAFLDKYHHMARSSTRAGISKLLGPARDYWCFGLSQ